MYQKKTGESYIGGLIGHLDSKYNSTNDPESSATYCGVALSYSKVNISASTNSNIFVGGLIGSNVGALYNALDPAIIRGL